MPRRPDEALLAAARAGDADGVALALRAGARLEARDGDRRTALLHAVIGDTGQAARALVALGADPQIADREGVTPWEHARRRGFDEIARLLAS